MKAVEDIALHANDRETSSMVILKEMGKAQINDFLLPAMDPALPWHGHDLERELRYTLKDFAMVVD